MTKTEHQDLQGGSPMPLTNARRTLVKNLSRTKTRRESGLFKAEGTKCVLDIIAAFPTEVVYARKDWMARHPEVDAIAVTAADLERMTSLSTAPEVIAVCRLPEVAEEPAAIDSHALTLALDGLQDPGNLGTIIRLADWFGIERIVCSADTVDCFSPKVVQSTMGSLGRVKVDYCNLPQLLEECGTDVFGTFLDGENLFAANLPRSGVIVIGNEGHGISEAVARCVTTRLSIPAYRQGAESLNAGIAAAITVARFRSPLMK